jgi:hypothetical protein
MNNLLGGGLAAAYGDLGTDETAADMPWQMAVVDVAALTAYAVVVLLIFRRRGTAARRAGAAVRTVQQVEGAHATRSTDPAGRSSRPEAFAGR